MMSLTPDQFRKSTLGVTPSPSPFFTPRPEKKRADYRGVDWNSNSSRADNKDKEVNVQVVLRCRPLIDDEQKINLPKVVSCNEHRREVTVMQSLANKQVDRLFTFDKVFGPKAQQRSIYDQAISPIVNDVLEGFNCTIFAYGQTGTGKTYTMEGGMRKKGTGELPAEAGVIPRAVRQIFDTLEGQNADYSMKVTFLELYNEEVTDLLASEDSPRSLEERTKRPISLMEDGKGCVVVRGLEEMAVYSANEIYSLLEQGASKRRTADTLLNKRSSRSHSVFSITVYIKESAVGDEELIKCGKLNLVDLAGSENISRSGAREGRAKEAGEINKSLLTLGRVINALVEHSPHVPYRDSKLTRLLRDSLGGKTKTCIIATISPSAHCLEETLSTLDYAYRAKTIKNKPEANQKMSKTVLLKDLYAEIERMREDVRAAREKNGVYILHDRFVQEELEKKAKNERIEQLEINLSCSEKEVVKFRELYLSEQEQKLDIDCELKNCKVDLENSNKSLLDLHEQHTLTLSILKEKEITISKLRQSEKSLIDRAKELSADLRCAAEDISSMFMRLDQKNRMATENQNTVLTFGSQLDQSLKNLHRSILGSVSHQQQHIRCMEEHVSSFLACKQDATQDLESKVAKMAETFNLGIGNLNDLANTLQMKASSDLGQMKSEVLSQKMAVEKFIANVALDAREVIGNVHNSLKEQKNLLAFSSRQQEEGLERGLLSAQVMSKATVDFVNDLYIHASDVMTLLEETQAEKTQQIAHFEKMFKEEAATEEQQAVEQITAILANLTSKRSKMVAEASQRIHESNARENQRLHKEMSYLQKVSEDTRNDLMDYMVKVEDAFLEDSFSAAECRAVMDDCLQECSELVDHSREQWNNAEDAVNRLNKTNIQEIESAFDENVRSNDVLHEDFLSASSSVGRDFSARVDETFAAVHDSLKQDHGCKEKLDSMASECIDQLRFVQEKHGESISIIRTHAEQCLTKEYQVDEHTGSTPKKRDINVPSFTSIEEMRVSFSENCLNGEESLESKLKMDRLGGTKAMRDSVSPFSRTPFADIN